MNKLSDLRKKLLSPGGVLLIPMFAIALGIHVALLAMPIPSSEALKPAEDQQDPIDVTQIPTTTPTSVVAKKTAKTPALKQTAETMAAARTATASSSPVDTNSSTATSDVTASTQAASSGSSTATAETELVATNEEGAIAASNPGNAAAPSTPSTPSAAPVTASSSPEPQSSTGPQPSTEPQPLTPTSEPSAPASSKAPVATTASDEPFASFPHYEAAEVDCFGLGFGTNCRTIENGKITEVSAFFQKELPSKAFQVAVVTDTPQHKVLKVSKQGTDRFLNIWQGPTTVSYLLAKVIYKQSPAEIKTESEP